MHHVEVDFQVWKALTALRESESHSYNQVLRDLLKLSGTEDEAKLTSEGSQISGRTLGGRFLPDGSKLQATYKGKLYHAIVEKGELIDASGKRHASASAAARAVTNTSVNGLMFWKVKRPTDEEWRLLAGLPGRK